MCNVCVMRVTASSKLKWKVWLGSAAPDVFVMARSGWRFNKKADKLSKKKKKK